MRDYERQPWPVDEQTEIYVTKAFGKRERIPMPNIKGGHSGGDERLKDAIFRGIVPNEQMKVPDSRAGAMSCLTGFAARTSVEQKRPVKLSELLKI